MDNPPPDGNYVITTASGRKLIKIGAFERLLPSDLSTLSDYNPPNDPPDHNAYYEKYSAGIGSNDHRKACEADQLLERFDDVVSIVVTLNDGRVVDRQYPYSSGRKTALIPTEESVLSDCHHRCTICLGLPIHPLRCIPQECDNALMANNEGLVHGRTLANPGPSKDMVGGLPPDVAEAEARRGRKIDPNYNIANPLPTHQHPSCRRCLGYNKERKPFACNQHSTKFVVSHNYPQRLTVEACALIECLYRFCPDGCRLVGNVFSLGPHLEAEHKTNGTPTAVNPNTDPLHVPSTVGQRTELIRRLKEYEEFVTNVLVPQMAEWFKSVQTHQQMLGRYHSTDEAINQQEVVVQQLRARIQELESEVVALTTERDDLRATHKSSEISQPPSLTSELALFEARTDALLVSQKKDGKLINKLIAKNATLTEEVARLQKAIGDASVQGGGEAASGHTCTHAQELELKDEEMRQTAVRLISARQEREAAIARAESAEERITLLEAELASVEQSFTNSQAQLQEAWDNRQIALTANDNVIQGLNDQIADLRQTLRDFELSENQDLVAARNIARALREDLTRAEDCIERYEARFGKNGFRDYPIIIYGLSPRPPVGKVEALPRFGHLEQEFMDVVVHFGSNTRRIEHIGTGFEVGQFRKRIEQGIPNGEALLRNYRLVAFRAYSFDEQPRRTKIGNFMPHCKEVHLYLIPQYAHSEPLDNPQVVQPYKAALAKSFGRHRDCPDFPPVNDPLGPLKIDQRVGPDRPQYTSLAGVTADSPTYSALNSQQNGLYSQRKRRRDGPHFDPNEPSTSGWSAPSPPVWQDWSGWDTTDTSQEAEGEQSVATVVEDDSGSRGGDEVEPDDDLMILTDNVDD